MQEIHAYLNGNKKEGSLVGVDYWSMKKKVLNQLASGKIEKLLVSITFLDKL